MKDIIKKMLFENESETDNTESKFFSSIGFKTEDCFNFIDYSEDKNLYPDYDEWDNEYGEDYRYKSKEECYSEINDVLSHFDDMEAPIKIYRAIKVKKEEDIDFENLGDYWSFDKDSAINFSQNQNHGNFLISGEIKKEDVDWKRTLDAFFQFSNNFDGYDENEITINDSDYVMNVTVERI